MYLRHFLLLFLILVEAEKVSYFSVERPQIVYLNTNLVPWANMTSRRVGRRDIVYYFNFSIESFVYFGNNVSVNFYFLEFLTNRYKPSFVEMHFRLCDLIEKDNFFGPGLRSGTFGRLKCPYGPGVYHVHNATIPVTAIPRGFPFSKGRIFVNATYGDALELFLAFHVDIELKQMRRSKS